MLQGQITTDRVRAALDRNGLGDLQFLKAAFESLTELGNERHWFWYIDPELDVLAVGWVYLWEHRGEIFGAL